MAEVKKSKLDENPHKLESEMGTRSDTRAFSCRQVLCHRFCLYIFPACAFIASVMLLSFAFRTPRPGISLGFSFLLLILAIFYCVVGNVVSKCWLPQSEHDSCDSDSDIYDRRNISFVVMSSAETLGEKV